MRRRFVFAIAAPTTAALLGLGGCYEAPSDRGGPQIGGEPAMQRGGGDDEGAALRKPSITDGRSDPSRPSVGLLRSGSGGCTATLIGTRTVLTAGHCVRNATTTFTVKGRSYTAQRIVRHPRYGGGNRNDVALVILSQAISGVRPSPIASSAPHSGQAIVLVGYGKTGEHSGGFGVKRSATNVISSMTSTTFSFRGAGNVCNGDSGGPSFVKTAAGQEIVVGVHSTKHGMCGSGGTDMRVDAYASWIRTSAGGDVTKPGSTPPQSPTTPPSSGSGGSSGSSACHQGTKLGWDYCSSTCPCGAGEGDCDSDSDCKSGLSCHHDVGARYGVNAEVDVCGAASGSTKPAPSTTASEGQSCSKQRKCGHGLACVPVYSSRSATTVGSYCMEVCRTLGTDPSCDGGEVCTRSRSSGNVCFNARNPKQGYTSPGSKAPSGSGSGAATPPSGGSSAGCGMTALESEVFKLLNKVRASNGAQPLRCDALAVKAARAHSGDMCRRGYFSHYTPEGKAPWHRLRDAGATFRSAGENIAGGQRTAQQVHDAWMKSAGHRRNMLGAQWTHVGIGYSSCNGRPKWTEDFTN